MLATALFRLGTFPLYKFIDFGEPFVRALGEFLKQPRTSEPKFGHLEGDGIDEQGNIVFRIVSGEVMRFMTVHPNFPGVYFEVQDINSPVLPGKESEIYIFSIGIIPGHQGA